MNTGLGPPLLNGVDPITLLQPPRVPALQPPSRGCCGWLRVPQPRAAAAPTPLPALASSPWEQTHGHCPGGAVTLPYRCVSRRARLPRLSADSFYPKTASLNINPRDGAFLFSQGKRHIFSAPWKISFP